MASNENNFMFKPVRPLKECDIEPATRLFFNTVHDANGSGYDEQQRNAWAPDVPVAAKWRERLHDQHASVIEDNEGLAGFMTLTREGHIDLAFVRVDLIGRGAGYLLYEAIEARAKEHKINCLTTDASKMARGFFEKHGWHVVSKQQTVRAGVSLTNYKMTKNL